MADLLSDLAPRFAGIPEYGLVWISAARAMPGWLRELAERMPGSARTGECLIDLLSVIGPIRADGTSPLKPLAEFVQRQSLRNATSGCLIAVWDLASLPETTSPIEWMRSLKEVERLCPSIACLGLCDSQSISFRDFQAAVSGSFLIVGDESACSTAVERWCVPDVDGRLNSCRRPSRWLGHGLSHGYFGNGVARSPLKECLQQSGLWEIQCELDYWQHSVASVLEFPDSKSDTRQMRSARLDEEPEIVRTISRSKCPLVVPRDWEDDLRKTGLEPGSDYRFYGTDSEALSVLQGLPAVERGILLHSADFAAPLAADLSYSVPRVLVDRSEIRLPFDEWPRRLRQNLVGTYTRDALFHAPSGKGDTLLQLKRGSWKPFATLSLQDALGRMSEIVARTLEAAMQNLPQGTGEGLLQRLYDSLRQIHCARKFYFGD